jgi:hypothetical protein
MYEGWMLWLDRMLRDHANFGSDERTKEIEDGH